MTLQDAFNNILDYFNGDIKKTLIWFASANYALGGISPVQMVICGREKKLIKFIESSLEGNHP